MKVGFIGIGQMGVHMAGHLLAAGFDVVVNDANREAAGAVLQRGAVWADSPAQVAEACRLVITCLPTPASVEEVALGPSGLAAAWQPGDIYIDMSTNAPSAVRTIAERARALGVDVLDSPVSGGTRGAEAGTLTLMVGGDAAALEKARPVLEPMANKIFHLGDVGCGNVAKLVNNLIGLICNSACAEGMALGARAGIDPQALYDLLTISTANNWSLQQYPRTVFQGDFEPGFKITLAYKDIGLALGLGEEYGVPLPVGEAVKADLEAAIAAGFGGKGVDAVILPREQATGMEVRVKGGQR
jgi:3-hydroxyisobutyrate dehydrogenase-like beta-hydroxyacid dehydrogenase